MEKAQCVHSYSIPLQHQKLHYEQISRKNFHGALIAWEFRKNSFVGCVMLGRVTIQGFMEQVNRGKEAK